MTTIYVIKHETFENTNVFTTQFEKIPEIIAEMFQKYSDVSDISEWSYITLHEGKEFDGDIDGHNPPRNKPGLGVAQPSCEGKTKDNSAE